MIPPPPPQTCHQRIPCTLTLLPPQTCLPRTHCTPLHLPHLRTCPPRNRCTSPPPLQHTCPPRTPCMILLRPRHISHSHSCYTRRTLLLACMIPSCTAYMDLRPGPKCRHYTHMLSGLCSALALSNPPRSHRMLLTPPPPCIFRQHTARKVHRRHQLFLQYIDTRWRWCSSLVKLCLLHNRCNCWSPPHL